MAKPLVIDVETTISNKGNPFDLTNKLVMVGTKYVDSKVPMCWEYWNSKAVKQGIQDEINHASILIGFNIKFDLHWLRQIGIDISNVKVWDCQIAEFLLNYQKTPYPSLDQAAEKYGFPKKLDVVKLEYWDKGIDTDKIPTNILSEYLTQDLILTQQVYEKQVQQFTGNGLAPNGEPWMKDAKGLYKLFRLQCQDLLVLEEMEYNGIKFDTEKALTKAKEIQGQLDAIVNEFSIYTGGIPINLNSNDHVSCLLYGGNICVDDRIPIGVYKSGAKEGQVRYKIITKEYPLPRIVEPIKGTEVKKPEGSQEYWLVNDTILRKLKLNKEAKKLVSWLKEYSELEKLRGTYLEGYSELISKMNWEKDMLHGTLNQCVAVTGRLSSTRPNLQNADPVTKLFMISRYT